MKGIWGQEETVPGLPYVRGMRPEAESQAAVELIAIGINDCEIGRRLEIPRGTIRDWQGGLDAGSGGRTKSWSGRRHGKCFRCEGGWSDEAAHAYLLGMYLGDGWIWEAKRSVYQIRIACDLKYPDIINEVATHIVIVRGVDRVGFAVGKGCVYVNAYWKHWPCVFPQHGPAKKHERPIELTHWQRHISLQHPKPLIRCLIHSDGNRHINKVRRTLATGPKQYRYSRYVFTYASSDILRLYTSSLDILGVIGRKRGHEISRCLDATMSPSWMPCRSQELTRRIEVSRECWNGRQDGLKHHCPKGRVGSNPTSRTASHQ
jgi:hypothetical protein